MDGLTIQVWGAVLDDGSKVRLTSMTSWLQIVNEDGSYHCNHGVHDGCPRDDHEIIPLYEMEEVT